MKDLPEITMSEWADAETRCKQNKTTPQPKGTITALQYAQMKGLGVSHSRKKLALLCEAGVATKEQWRTDGKVLTVYRTVKK